VIDGETAVYALLGSPVARSRSPALHNAWFAETGRNAVYVALEVRDGAAIDAAWAIGLRGANLTTPLKELAVGRVRCDGDAAAIGAVNLLVREDGGWVGGNTDAEGFVRSLEARGIAIAGRRCVVLGAGGAARAVVVGLRRRGAGEIAVRARRPERAREVAALVGGSGAALDRGAARGADLVVVATSGRVGALAELDLDRLGADPVWVDLNYWDPDPPGSARAGAAGCAVVDGLGMLEWQAALSFERWTGIAVQPPSVRGRTAKDP
jgi:shikimate dehydrogenase